LRTGTIPPSALNTSTVTGSDSTALLLLGPLASGSAAPRLYVTVVLPSSAPEADYFLSVFMLCGTDGL